MNAHMEPHASRENAVACPHCHSNRTRRSRRKRLADWLMVCRLASPYRCCSCGYRFHSRHLGRRH